MFPCLPHNTSQPVVEPEPPLEDPQPRTISVVSEPSSQTSWSSTTLAFGDAISSVRRIFEEPHYLDMAKNHTEPDLVMDLLQDVSNAISYSHRELSNAGFDHIGT
jgi:hypothetical protein